MSHSQGGAVQIPVVSGLNLYGHGRFCYNPHYVESEDCDSGLQAVLSKDAVGLIADHSDDLWRLYYSDPLDLESTLLRDSILPVLGKLTTVEEKAVFLDGIRVALRSRFSESKVLFEPSRVTGLIMSLAIKHSGEDAMRLLLDACIDEFITDSISSRGTLDKSLQANEYFLLSDRSGFDEFFYLPVRISAILGWLSVGGFLEEGIKGKLASNSLDSICGIVRRCYEQYGDCFRIVSELQAPPLLYFFDFCRRHGKSELAEMIWGEYYTDFASTTGSALRIGQGGESIFNYLHSRSLDADLRAIDGFAGLSHTLPVILSAAEFLSSDEQIILKSFDRLEVNIYAPESYADFGDSTMQTGMNHIMGIGRDIWQLTDFEKEYEGILQGIEERIVASSPVEVASALICSLIFPDRAVWGVEPWLDSVHGKLFNSC
jgi:hypothetical protein